MKPKIMILTGIAALSLTMVTTFAASQTAVDTLARLTTYDKEEIQEMIDSGKRPSEIVFDLGLWEQFKEAMQEHRRERLAYRVERGDLTQEEADELLKEWNEARGHCLDPDNDTFPDRSKMQWGRRFNRINGNN